MERKYTWSKEEIDEIIEQLEEISDFGGYCDDEVPALYYSLNTYVQIKSYLEVLNKSKDSKPLDSVPSMTEEINEFYKWMAYERRDFKGLFSDKTIELINYFSSFQIPERKLLSPLCISEQEIVDSVKSGLSSFDKRIYNYWLKLQESHPNMIQFCNTIDGDDLAFGQAFYDPYNNIPYILSGRANNVSDFDTINHESGHVLYYTSHYFNSNRNTEVYMSEVPAFFIELIGMSNLPSNFSSQIELLNADHIEKAISLSKLLTQQLDLYKKILQGRSYRKGKIHYDLSPDEEILVRKSNSNTYVFNMMYLYSYLIAKYMKSEYDNSPNTMVRTISPLYNPSNSRTISHVYNQMGINEDALKDVFESEAKKYGAKRAN